MRTCGGLTPRPAPGPELVPPHRPMNSPLHEKVSAVPAPGGVADATVKVKDRGVALVDLEQAAGGHLEEREVDVARAAA